MGRFSSASAKTKLTTTNNITKTNLLLFLGAKIDLFLYTGVISCYTFFFFCFIFIKQQQSVRITASVQPQFP